MSTSCLCDAGFIKSGRTTCISEGVVSSYSISQPIVPPTTMLTKGTVKESGGKFTTAPVTLFVYEAGQAVQLAFQVNFTFTLSPQSGRTGSGGFAFVISATDKVGSGSGVGYSGMDSQSIAVEFDTLQDKQQGDMPRQHVGLNIQGHARSVAAVKAPFTLNNRKPYTAWVDYEPGEPGTIQVFLAASEVKPKQPLLERRMALCEVLQAGAEQQEFFFGFVAATVKPFQMHVILKLAMHTNASWAYAVVASVEAAYGIALNREAPRLSVDSLFAAMGLTSPAAKCTRGNSPAAAFQKLLTLRRPRRGARKPRSSVRKVFENPCNPASAFTIIGTSDSLSVPPFWIVRNSWGVERGDRGHMRMDIQGGDGVCGINVLPGIYPIVKISKDLCGQRSYKGVGDLQPSMNPCGRFTCKANAKTKRNTCNCTIPNQAIQPFVAVANGLGSRTCAYVDVCSSYAMNPCGVGTCVNDGKGAYSCICPPNYIKSTTVDNSTCDPCTPI
ncbi:unnamed protein product [Closterium sp. Yama58-4]|nr:unnamed protein product [Closterium sp. Yama58-4]